MDRHHSKAHSDHPPPNGRGSVSGRAIKRLLVPVMGALLLACSQPADSDVAVEPPSQPPPTAASSLPEAILPDDFRITLELALTSEEIVRGMMFRPSLPDDRGMLFVFSQERIPSFWMKNTIIPLDLVFLDSSGQIVDIIPNAQPCAAEPCPNYIPDHPAQAVLEVAAGVAGRHNLVVGDVIQILKVDSFPVKSAPQIAGEE